MQRSEPRDVVRQPSEHENPAINKTCQSGLYHLHNNGRIKRYLSFEDRVDCSGNCDIKNRLLYGVAATNLCKLQRVQNAALRLVWSLPRHEHITSSFIRLHWLPIKFRINFKIAMLCFKCIHGPSIKKAWSPARRLRHTTSARAPVSSWKTIHDDRKNCLAIEPFPMHPPRFGTFSRNH